MATKIRTLNFLPEVFQTNTNKQFLAATLDQIVQQPELKKIQGYIGSRLGYGINANDYYVTEPTKVRTDYQLDPGVVFTKENESTAKDFISYPGILDALKLQGALTENNNRLFTSQIYSWDSFTNLDKIINFNQYYWIPEGPERVVVATDIVYSTNNYSVTSLPNGYTVVPITSASSDGSLNPTITLLRGGTYTFAVNQNSQFWIQGEPGVTGYSLTQPNLQTREVYGVDNNGASQGIVTFTVPAKDAQNEYDFPGNNLVDLVSTLPFSQINGMPANQVTIDGVTALENLTVMFYNTGQPYEIGYTSNFFDYTAYDENNDLTLLKTISVVATTSNNYVVCDDTSELTVDNAIIFNGTPFGNIQAYSATLPNTIYYVEEIINNTTFTISPSYASTEAALVVSGQTYKITTIGTTDWTLLGAASNTVGLVFTATSSGTSLSGNGTARQIVDLVNDSGTMTGVINQGQYEQGYESTVSENFYRIQYIGDPSEPVIRLVKVNSIPINQKITAVYGTQWINRNFYKNVFGTTLLIPYISAPLDVLYYQDGTSANKVGIIKIIESNTTNTIDVVADILGKKQYTSTNGVKFTNGLKVSFQGDVFPRSYLTGEYYVEGVGTSIELLPVENFIVPEDFTASTYNPWDLTPWDSLAWEGNSYIPLTPDYITIARNSIDKNAWSRSNRWFHIDVINATAGYNNNESLITLYTNSDFKAKRPIIEFDPNLKLMDSGSEGKAPVDFIDIRTTDAFSYVAGQQNYYPDIEVYTGYSATITSTDYTPDRFISGASGGLGGTGIFTLDTGYNTTGFRVNDLIIFDSITPGSGITPGGNYYVSEIVSSTQFKISSSKNGSVLIPSINITGVYQFTWSPQSTIVTIPASSITGTFTVGQYVTDSTNVIPRNAQIISITGTTTLTLTLDWDSASNYFTTQTNASIVGSDTTVDNYALFDGARVIFTIDTNPLVKNKIYIARFSTISGVSAPVITLTEADDGNIEFNNQTVALRGYTNHGKEFWFDSENWIEGQQKVNVNQSPLFDVFDKNGISFGDSSIYIGTSFRGSTLFSYGLGSGLDDSVLGFPIRYSSVDNIGDISFDVSLNSDTFDYVIGSDPITQKVNTGYIFNYITRTEKTRKIGWQTAVSPSIQYQVFEFNYDPLNPTLSFICDVAKSASTSTNWPTIKVLNNNNLLTSTSYSVLVGPNTTTVTLASYPVIETKIQILILSEQVSKTAYFTIPTNLNNNPFNQDVTVANLGDIRGQYQSIFFNNPEITGEVFGSNNFRDLGNMVPWGDKIIQNSASLVLSGAFLRNKDHNLFNALIYNSREYVKFKNLLVYTVQNSDYQQRFAPAVLLDDALDQISATKTESQPFFWSDMLPSKAVYKSSVYNFANSLDVSIYPLDRIYDYNTANYYGVLVYLTRVISGVSITKQLIINQDYEISSTAPSLIITLDLLPGDQITVNEYNQTYGSYVPNTPTKLGLYPAFAPQVVLDSNYTTPTYFIKGHDGSYTKLYGEYDPNTGVLVDFRDQVLLEFELRIYNNLKLDSTVPIKEYEIVPGFFRNTDYSYDDWLLMYSTTFLSWVGQNRLNYKTQLYNSSNEFTWNYYQSGNAINGEPIQQGYWRGVYQYFYDTTTPNSTPWEMLGFTEIPTWWTDRYGPAPYTSDNLVLWGDLEQGINWNDGDPVVIPEAARPGLLEIIPVDDQGNLLNPMQALIGNYNERLFRRDWKVGDDSPVEFSYRRSSSYPFDLMRLTALMKPAEFFNLAVDLDNYKFNTEFNQYLVDDRSHLQVNQIEIYGNGTAKTSYINWIVDYEKQIGLDATTNIQTLLDNLDVRLVYRMAGFSDKTLLKFFVEKGTPNSRNASLLIPDESYSLLLYDNQPFTQVIYSSVIIQLLEDGGYSIYGNSQIQPYFKTLKPKFAGEYVNFEVENLTLRITPDHFETEQIIPYGTVYYSVQEIAQFLSDYGAYLEKSGMKFEEKEYEITINWDQMIAEFMYWAQTGWTAGSVVTLNPSAKTLTIDKDSCIVQPLTMQQNNFVLNQNLYPIQTKDLAIVREGVTFNIAALNDGDTISYGQFNISNFEHGIVFDNITIFGDILYNLITGLRQNRILLRGTKSAAWNGTVNASGFIYNQNNILEWSNKSKYTKGEIVTYKNKYWIATKIIQPSDIFKEEDWKRTDYNEVQKGLLPNSSTNSYESTLYYDINQANLEQDADLLGFSLIGYRPRDYLALADLTDITQVNVYKNLIKNKGTENSVKAFKGAQLPQGGIDYEVYENWAIKSGEFGGVLNGNFIEFKINEKYLTGNPAIVGLTNGLYNEGAQQEVPIYSLYNYNRPVTDVNVLPTVDVANTINNVFPDAGYVNYNDVKMSAFFYSQLPQAVNKNGIVIPIDNFYVRDYVWLANYKEKWEVFTPYSIGQIIVAQNNLNETVTITFNQPHNLEQYDPLAIVNFDVNINGYYIASLIVDPFRVIINKSLDPSIRILTGQGIAMALTSQRVDTPSDITTLPLLESEFRQNTVWVDNDSNGSWGVYRKTLNYNLENQFTKQSSQAYGSAVATGSKLGYLISDPDLGNVYRYAYNELTKNYDLIQIITESGNFGSAIKYAGDLYGILSPNSNTLKIYQLQNTIFSDDLIEIQDITVTSPESLAFSGDQKWLYVGRPSSNIVYAYKQEYIPTTAGYFIIGKTYEITEVGTTDFTTVGATGNTAGVKFIATGIGSGTGTATQITYNLAATINGASLGIATTGDSFGHSISTDYYGDCLFIGAPFRDYSTISNWGYAYIFDRISQNIEVQYTNQPLEIQTLQLAWTPTTVQKSVSSTTAPSTITLNNTSGLTVNDPIIFTTSGTGLSGTDISTNQVYYIRSIVGSTITIKEDRDSITAFTLLTNPSVTATVHAQTESLFVYRNGKLVADNNYAVVNDTLIYTTQINAGDIIQVDGRAFNLSQTLTTQENPQIGAQFGLSVDTNTYGSELLIGAPFQLNSQFEEGTIYRFTDAGAKYGTITGTNTCNVTSVGKLLINGYLVYVPVGDAATVANAITGSNITNVTATSVDGRLVISLIDKSLAQTNEKLTLSVADTTILAQLGIQLFTLTQEILCPHRQGPTQFGTSIKFNEFGSFVASAPVGTRYSATTFDFVDDENQDNDTIFDNNATMWIDETPNFGAVYMFDYVSQYNESLANPGKFVYAQSINSSNFLNVASNTYNQTTDITYNNQPRYGTALDFNGYQVIAGTPNDTGATTGFNYAGSATTFKNVKGIKDWHLYRSSSAVVDISRIYNIQLFSAETNNTLVNLDYIDPLQGKILGAARENIDIISNNDPASYNNDLTLPGNIVWGADHLGTVWLDTSNMRYVNYHQNDDITYNAQYWGTLFPGSDVAVYSWISSNVVPAEYQGPGTPYQIDSYSVQLIINAAGALTPIYYYWVRDTNTIFVNNGKTLADSIVAAYIQNPKTSGIGYFTPVLPNVFALYNSNDYFNANDSVLHIGYATGTNDAPTHNQFNLIRTGYPEDFLPGIPLVTSGIPDSLYDRMLDSLCGVDETGAVVPNPYLPKAVQSGVLARPRQSFFLNRYTALKNYFQYTNEILSQYAITEIRQNLSFLFTKNNTEYVTIVAGNCQPGTTYTIEQVGEVDWTTIGASENAVGTTFVATGIYSGEGRNTGLASFLAFTEGEKFDTAIYWEYVNWWVPGYDDNTKSAYQVQQYADLSTLTVPAGTIARVFNNGTKTETYLYTSIGSWQRIGLERGTIQFKNSLWDYSSVRFGFGDNFYDTNLYDEYPSEETRYILRAINEQIFTEDLLIHRNKSLVLLFEYIQSEATENQNYLPWLNKTSFIDVSHKIRELRPIEVYQTDNQEFLSGYLNEVKPYHVVIKEFLFKYTGNELYGGNVTDFDLPAKYDKSVEQFISPQLVFTEPSTNNQFLPSNDIWQEQEYNQWYQNYGLTIGQPTTTNGITKFVGETDFQLTTLSSYISLTSEIFSVDNAQGFPLNGVIQIDNEKIGYSVVDRALNTISGLTRGVDGTEITVHIPGANIYMDLPAVILLDGGRSYTEPPKVTAYIDTSIYPAPTRPAILVPQMSLDSVLSITVEDSGDGYVVLPEIVIDPAIVVNFTKAEVNFLSSTIRLFAPLLQTGDLVQYRVVTGSTPIGGLQDKQWYYINILETSPTSVLGFYDNYADALNDHDRIRLYDTGSTDGHTINLGARASAVTAASPIRENIITLRFDRTSYNSEVLDWTSGNYYGAYYAGAYTNSESVASSSIGLQSTQPPIDSILASAQGVAFEVVDLRNDRQVVYSSFVRQVESTVSSNNSIKLVLQDDGSGNPNASGGTLGFYIGMPIKFKGNTATSGLVNEQVYYVNSIISLTDFTVSVDPSGSPQLALSNFTVGPAGLECYVGEVTDLAVIEVNYPGILTVTATQAETNYIITPLNPTGTGGTKGFYINLPVFFTGTVNTSPSNGVFGDIVENQPYYVTTVVDKETFTISKTKDPLTFTVVATDAATDVVQINGDAYKLSVNESIIFNTMVVSGTETNSFGGLVSGAIYYVSIITGPSTFKVSTSINGPVEALSTVAASSSTSALLTSQKDTLKLVTADSSSTPTLGMVVNVNLPVSPGQVNGQRFTMYQTSEVFIDLPGSDKTLIMRHIAGMVGNRTVEAGNFIIDEVYTISFVGTTDFTLIGAASNTIGVTFTATGIGSGTGTATIAVNRVFMTNFIEGNSVSLGLTNLYVNMPLEVSESFGTSFLSASTTYYIIAQGTATANVTTTTASGNLVTCDSTASLIVDMPIYFSGTGIGGIDIDVEYYVKTIVNDTQFTLSETPNGSELVLTNEVGNMILTGLPYVKVATSIGGSEIDPGDTQQAATISIALPAVITVAEAPATNTKVIFRTTGSLPTGMLPNIEYYVTNTGPTTFTISLTAGGTAINTSGTQSGSHVMIISTPIQLDQTPTTAPNFDVSYLLGGYSVVINNSGSGYAVDNEIIITGVNMGGTSPANDLLLTVTSVGSLGEITQVIRSGTPPGIVDQYYFEVISPNEFAIYQNALMTVPVSGLTLPYQGITQTTVTETQSSTDIITVTSTSGFAVNDPVVFTGTITGGMELGKTYYILDNANFTSTTLQVSELPGGSVFGLTTALAPQSYSMAKSGSIVLLPEPFIFNQSIVKYNNRVYVCVISNNDDEFVFGKWQLLRSEDRRLNAMDRVYGYYQPTDNMPGKDLTQLFKGVAYPYNIYLDNPFAPAEQYPLDTILKDQEFYPTDVDVRGITWDGASYFAAANMPTYSSVISNNNSSEWNILKLANTPLSTTDIIFADGIFVLTSNNAATPIFRSQDGITWTTNGYYLPYSATPYDTTNYDMTALSVASLSLNSVAYNNNIWVAVGQNIVSSTDTYIWNDRFAFTNPLLSNELFGVDAVSIPTFTGFIAVGKGQQMDYSTGIGVEIDVDLIITSTDGINWAQIPTISSVGLYAVADNGTIAVAVGEDGAIYISSNATNWFGINRTSVISTNGATDVLNIFNTTGLSVDTPIRFNNAFDVVATGTTYYVAQIITSTQIRISLTNADTAATAINPGDVYLITSLGTTDWNVVAGTVAITYAVGDVITAASAGTGSGTARELVDLSGTGSIPIQTVLFVYPQTATLRDIIYSNGIFMTVGESGLIRTSPDALNWTTRTSGTTQNLYGVIYNSDDSTWTAVGDNNTIISSIDNGVTWTSSSVFAPQTTIYNVKGPNFEFGYGPEELVPGVVTDNLSMIVATRPGTNWDETIYAHVGYNVVSLELSPSSGTQTVYSFDARNIYDIQTPAAISVYIINGTTNVCTGIYETYDYTVDWVNFTLTLNTPLVYSPVSDKLRIDVYEVGNGNQLVKASTETDPIRLNMTTGWNEIYVNCNYTGEVYQGSGVIQPGSFPVDTFATETIAATNSIVLDSVRSLSLNAPVSFQGTTFGGIVEETLYYVKSIGYVNNTIVLSATFNVLTGTAGPAFALSDATGYMTLIIKTGSASVFTEPIIKCNGDKLLLGNTGTVTKTKSSNNGITISSTAGMVVGERIVFSDTMFGPDITPQTTYYIQSVIDANEFTISVTNGGPVLVLTDATGGAQFITNDYAFGIQPNGISAKIIFATGTYDAGQDYITYTLFGETSPQYGYTLPEIQTIVADGTVGPYTLDNFIGDDNPTNAIVEVNGLRLTSSDYTINFGTNEITFTSPVTLNDIIAVTSFNQTERQYLNTQYGLTGNTVAPIINVNNAVTPFTAVTNVTNTTVTTNIITCVSTTGFIAGQTVVFKGTGFGGIATDGTVYYVRQVVSPTTFTIEDETGNIIVLTTASGLIIAYVGGQPAVRITTSIPHNLSTNDVVKIDGVGGSTQLNNNDYYVHVINSTQVDLYFTSYDPAVTAVNDPVTAVSSYIPGSGGYIWISGTYTLITTYVTATSTSPVTGNLLTVTSVSDLVIGTPIVFTGTAIGGLSLYTTYYIKEIIGSQISISETRGGEEVVVTNDAGSMQIAQWEQDNVDRLWVTVNGYRIPSSRLKLNPGNQVSILAEVQSADEVIITSMMPSATPNEEVYYLNVNQTGDSYVNRDNTQARTWLTQPLSNINETIYVQDVTRITDTVVQTNIVPAAIDNIYSIGLNSDKSIISSITVYNNTTGQTISSSNYEVVVESLSPILKITAGSYITVGDTLTITILEGNLIYINGEQIKFTTVDLANNTITGLQRGSNGTGTQEFIDVYTEVYGLLTNNRLSAVDYSETWNSNLYNETEGDPLQISVTEPAIFLRGDVN